LLLLVLRAYVSAAAVLLPRRAYAPVAPFTAHCAILPDGAFTSCRAGFRAVGGLCGDLCNNCHHHLFLLLQRLRCLPLPLPAPSLPYYIFCNGVGCLAGRDALPILHCGFCSLTPRRFSPARRRRTSSTYSTLRLRARTAMVAMYARRFAHAAGVRTFSMRVPLPWRDRWAWATPYSAHGMPISSTIGITSLVRFSTRAAGSLAALAGLQRCSSSMPLPLPSADCLYHGHTTARCIPSTC